jgi:hypothetical protein
MGACNILVLKTGTPLNSSPKDYAVTNRLKLAILMCAICAVAFTEACKSAVATASDAEFSVDGAGAGIVERRFLSGDYDDWEPSLAVGPDGTVAVVTLRNPPPKKGSAPRYVVVWISKDNGKTFSSETFPDTIDEGLGGDERVALDANGTVYVSWLGMRRYGVPTAKNEAGALNLAISRDQGKTFTVRTIASRVSDKPEILVTPDGRSIYAAFMGRKAQAEVIVSHDGGESWTRHQATFDSINQYWPTSLVRGPDNALWMSIPVVPDLLPDSIHETTLHVLRSADDGATWRDTILSRGKRVRQGCVHDPSCRVKLPNLSLAVDAKNRVYVAYTNGEVGSRHALYITRSTDNGKTWSTPREIGNAKRPKSGDLSDAGIPAIVARGDGEVYVVWTDDRDGPVSVWAKHSTDGGETWSRDVKLSQPNQPDTAGYYGHYGGIAIDRTGALHATWSEGRGTPGTGRGGTWYAKWDGK